MASHVRKKGGASPSRVNRSSQVFCKLEKRYLVLVIKSVSIVPHFYHILDVYKCWAMDYFLFLLFPAVMEKR
jgi:hypothetical protein